MAVLEHPVWDKSFIPPRTLAKINRLDSEGRRLYVAQLLYDNSKAVDNVKAVAVKMQEEWLDSQVIHLEKVRLEYEAILSLEVRGNTDFKGHMKHGTT